MKGITKFLRKIGNVAFPFSYPWGGHVDFISFSRLNAAFSRCICLSEYLLFAVNVNFTQLQNNCFKTRVKLGNFY